MKTAELIKKLEECKTTKSAITLLRKNNISYEEGFGKSYDFNIDGTHYRVMKSPCDTTCQVIKYEKRVLDGIESTLRLMKYGYSIG